MGIFEAIWDVLNTPVTKIQERDLTLLSIVQLLVILFIGWAVARYASRLTRHIVVDRVDAPEAVGKASARAVRMTAIFAGVYLALTSIGFDLAILLVPLGGLSVGIGFGMQDVAKNLIAGVITLTEKRVRKGQRIEIRGFQGVIDGIGLRSTTIVLDDGTKVMLANGDFMSQPLKIVAEVDEEEVAE